MYLYLFFRNGATEDFVAVPEKAGFPSEAQGIHVNRKQ